MSIPKTVWVTCAINALYWFTTGLTLLPYPELFIEIFGENHISEASVFYGFCDAVMYTAQLFGSPFLGELADRVGFRPTFFLIFGAFTVDWLILSSVTFPTRYLAFLSNTIHGFFDAAYQTCSGMLSRAVPSEKFPDYIGKVQAAGAVGLLIGTGASATVTSIWPGRTIFIVTSISNLFGLILVYFFVREPVAAEEHLQAGTGFFRKVLKAGNPARVYRFFRDDPKMRALVPILITNVLQVAATQVLFDFYLTARFDLSLDFKYLIIGAIIFCQIFFVAFLTEPVLKKRGVRRAFLETNFCMIMFHVQIAFAPNQWWFLFAGVWMYGFISTVIVASSFLNVCEVGKEGFLFGAISMVSNISNVVARLVYTQVFSIGNEAGFPQLPMWLTALVGVLGQLIINVNFREEIYGTRKLKKDSMGSELQSDL